MKRRGDEKEAGMRLIRVEWLRTTLGDQGMKEIQGVFPLVSSLPALLCRSTTNPISSSIFTTYLFCFCHVQPFHGNTLATFLFMEFVM